MNKVELVHLWMLGHGRKTVCGKRSLSGSLHYDRVNCKECVTIILTDHKEIIQAFK